MAASPARIAPELEWDPDANIHLRMMLAQASARRLEKEKPADEKAAGFLKNGFITHDAVTFEGMRILTAHGIHFQPYLRKHSVEGNRTIVEMEGVFTNVDKPDEKLSFLGIGYGIDSSDKGPGKAMSYAKKMVLSQALMLNTHEDIEQTNQAFEPSVGASAVKDAEATTEVAIRSWADAYQAALKGVRTKKDLAKIRAENAHMMKSEALPEVTRDYFVDMITQLEGSLE